MPVISEKLKFRKSGTTIAISLHSEISELLGAEHVDFRVDGATVYAALGEASNANATSLRVRKSGATKAFLSSVPIELPTGTVGVFDAACPTGWTQLTAHSGKFMRGSATYGTTGPPEPHSHSVVIAATSTGSASPTVLDNGFGSLLVDRATGGVSIHNHAVVSTTPQSDPGEPVPKNIEIILCTKD